MSEIVEVKNDEVEIVNESEADFFDEVDAIMEAYLSKRKMIQLSERTFRFAQDILDAHHILVSPEIPRGKEISLLCQALKISDTKARRIRRAHILIWGESKGQNDAFQKRLIADKILKFAQKEEEEGDREKAAEYYEKYYRMRGFDKEDTNRKPRTLPKILTFSNNPKLLEVEDAQIIEDGE